MVVYEFFIFFISWLLLQTEKVDSIGKMFLFSASLLLFLYEVAVAVLDSKFLINGSS